MLERIEARTPGTPILVLNASVGDESLWRFDPTFDEDELLTVGSQFVASLLGNTGTSRGSLAISSSVRFSSSFRDVPTWRWG